jgi:peptide/nickel transport system ATP-binding protein
MAIIIITHDLGVVAEIADEICVMYAGRIVERASTQQIFSAPQHPYTWGLLKSIPRLDTPRGEELVPIAGRPPSLINRPSGCHFHPRCPYAQEEHKRVDPKLEPVPGDPGHSVACLLAPELRTRIWAGLQAGRPIAELQRLAGPGTETAPADPLRSATDVGTSTTAVDPHAEPAATANDEAATATGARAPETPATEQPAAEPGQDG